MVATRGSTELFQLLAALAMHVFLPPTEQAFRLCLTLPGFSHIVHSVFEPTMSYGGGLCTNRD